MDALVLKQQCTKYFHRWTPHSTGIPKQTGAGGAGEQCMHATLPFLVEVIVKEKKKRKMFFLKKSMRLDATFSAMYFLGKKLKWCFFTSQLDQCPYPLVCTYCDGSPQTTFLSHHLEHPRLSSGPLFCFDVCVQHVAVYFISSAPQSISASPMPSCGDGGQHESADWCLAIDR